MNFPGAIWAARLILLAAVLFLISLLIMGGLAFGYPASKLDRPTPTSAIDVGDLLEDPIYPCIFRVAECWSGDERKLFGLLMDRAGMPYKHGGYYSFSIDRFLYRPSNK